MTSEERLTLTNHKHERQQQLVRQLIVNADIRRRWAEADHLATRSGRGVNDGAIIADNFSRVSFPFKMLKVFTAVPRFFSIVFHIGRRHFHDQPIMEVQNSYVSKMMMRHQHLSD